MYSNSILDDLKNIFRQNNIINQIILVNVGVFVLVGIINVISWMIGLNSFDLSYWLSIPASLPALLLKPWTLITYMFLHVGFFHILFNMLWFYWFAQILVNFLGMRKILPIYIYGGLFGAALYIIAYNIFPVFQNVLPAATMMGASAGVLAIVVAAATLSPDFTIHLMFIGPVKIKYIALFSIILDLIQIPHGNAGGHIAHLGGALFGFLFIKQLQAGNDWSKPFNNFMDAFVDAFKPRSKSPKMTYTKTASTAPKKTSKSNQTDQAKIDAILDKISASGYDSLTATEKEMLFKHSKK